MTFAESIAVTYKLVSQYCSGKSRGCPSVVTGESHCHNAGKLSPVSPKGKNLKLCLFVVKNDVLAVIIAKAVVVVTQESATERTLV